jgi:ATP/maltotriose-dependent transcriptional regulator MalT
MAALLGLVVRQHAPVAGYAARLLAACPQPEASQPGDQPAFSIAARAGSASHDPLSPQLLAEPLSAREREVLGLLAEGRDNAEIARALGVAVSTIKSHVNHIFGKLGVTNRLEAVLRARQFNLL